MSNSVIRRKESLIKTFIIVITFGFIVILFLLHKFALQTPRGYTALYFEDYSDLPNPAKKGNIEPFEYGTQFLETDKSYNIVFTIASYENTEMKYICSVSSPIYQNNSEFTIRPGERKAINAPIKPITPDWKSKEQFAPQTFKFKYTPTNKYKSLLKIDIAKLLNLPKDETNQILGLEKVIPDFEELEILKNITIYFVHESFDIAKKKTYRLTININNKGNFLAVDGNIKSSLEELELKRFTVNVKSTAKEYEIFFNFSVR